MLISIILPTYNSSTYIPIALDSILAQSFKDFEIVIVDNLSTDGTVKIIEDYGKKDGRIMIYTGKDEGIYDAMNKGISYAKGDWLYFMGADDSFVNRQVLDKIVPFLNTGNDLVYGDSIWMPDNTRELGEWGYEKLIHQNINHQRIFYRKRLFEKFSDYNLRYKIAADHDLNIRFFCNSEIRKRHIPILVAFFHTGGFSANKMDIPFWEDWDQTIKKPFTGILSKKIIFGSLGKYIRVVIHKGYYRKAVNLMAKHFCATRSFGFLKLMLLYFRKD